MPDVPPTPPTPGTVVSPTGEVSPPLAPAFAPASAPEPTLKRRPRHHFVLAGLALVVIAGLGTTGYLLWPKRTGQPAANQAGTHQPQNLTGTPVQNDYQLFLHANGPGPQYQNVIENGQSVKKLIDPGGTLTLTDAQGHKLRQDPTASEVELVQALGNGLFLVKTGLGGATNVTLALQLYDKQGFHPLTAAAKASGLATNPPYFVGPQHFFAYNATNLIFENCKRAVSDIALTDYCQTSITDVHTGAQTNLDRSALKAYSEQLAGISPDHQHAYYLALRSTDLTNSINQWAGLLRQYFNQSDSSPAASDASDAATQAAFEKLPPPPRAVLEVDIKTGKLVQQWPVSLPQITAFDYPDQACFLSPDGRTVVYGDKAGAIHAVDVQSNTDQIIPLPSAGWRAPDWTEQGSSRPVFSPDGTKLALYLDDPSAKAPRLVYIDLAQHKSFASTASLPSSGTSYHNLLWLDNDTLVFATNPGDPQPANYRFQTTSRTTSTISALFGQLLTLQD